MKTENVELSSTDLERIEEIKLAAKVKNLIVRKTGTERVIICPHRHTISCRVTLETLEDFYLFYENLKPYHATAQRITEDGWASSFEARDYFKPKFGVKYTYGEMCDLVLIREVYASQGADDFRRKWDTYLTFFVKLQEIDLPIKIKVEFCSDVLKTTVIEAHTRAGKTKKSRILKYNWIFSGYKAINQIGHHDSARFVELFNDDEIKMLENNPNSIQYSN